MTFKEELAQALARVNDAEIVWEAYVEDVEALVKYLGITLEDLEKLRGEVCGECDGIGNYDTVDAEFNPIETFTCPTCNGAGRIRKYAVLPIEATSDMREAGYLGGETLDVYEPLTAQQMHDHLAAVYRAMVQAALKGEG